MLVKEKALTRSRDALAGMPPRMPWTPVDKHYEFEGPDGRLSWLDLSTASTAVVQLIVYRAFVEPGVHGWPEHGCIGCSLMADHIGNLAHLNARDTTLVYVSRGPQPTSSASSRGWVGKCLGTQSFRPATAFDVDRASRRHPFIRRFRARRGAGWRASARPPEGAGRRAAGGLDDALERRFGPTRRRPHRVAPWHG